ncbi:hypothetical protein LLH00_13625 [bacterium]|nr:hypothetical protein [bacterium]
MKRKSVLGIAATVLLLCGLIRGAAAQSFGVPVYAKAPAAAPVRLAAKADTTYVEDFNEDRVVDLQDVIWLSRNGMVDSAHTRLDYHRDGKFDLLDVMTLMVNILQGNLSMVIHGGDGIYPLMGRVMEGAVGLSGVHIYVRGAGLDTTFLTNNLGMFQLDGLKNGEYVVRAARGNYKITPDSLNVTINGDTLMIPNITAVYSGFGVLGKVTADSLGLPMVNIRAQGVGIDTTVVSDGAGKYRIIGLPAGSYVLRPSREYYTFTPDSLLISLGAGQTVDAPEIKAKFNNPTQVNLHKISGKITCSSGGLSNILVYLYDSTGKQIHSLTDQTGTFYFLVPDGRYTIIPMSYIGYAYNPISWETTVGGYDLSGMIFYMYGVENPVP